MESTCVCECMESIYVCMSVFRDCVCVRLCRWGLRLEQRG